MIEHHAHTRPIYTANSVRRKQQTLYGMYDVIFGKISSASQEPIAALTEEIKSVTLILLIKSR